MGSLMVFAYELVARKYLPGVYKDYLLRLNQDTSRKACILEVAPGPGHLSIALAKHDQIRVSALDISKKFISRARKNAQKAKVNMDFTVGDVHQMPYAEGQFDLVIATAALKSFKHPVKALNQIHRVLKPGGSLWLTDLRQDTTRKKLKEMITNTMKAKGLPAYVLKNIFFYYLRKKAFTENQVKDMVKRSNFQQFTTNTTPTEVELRAFK